MIKNNKFRILFATLILIVFLINFVTGFEFNGTVKDVDGNLLNNSVVNITVRSTSGFTVVGYNFTTTNASGWFNMTVNENAAWMYEPKITWRNLTTGAIEWIGQNLPAFPQEMLSQVAGTTFFLKQGGTINITAINITGSKISFKYQIKDQKLGYSIASNFDSSVNETIINVPRDRNYSIMIFPDNSMPVSFNWDNFSASQSYNISNLSNYNFTTKTLRYQFNTTMTIVRVSGFINYSGISGWNEFTVVPYLLEPGNMVHSSFGSMPYNLSGFIGQTDNHTLTNGSYSISLPSTPAETSSILLFATARNGSNYYGGFRNISNLGGGGLTQFNFSAMSGLFGTASNISMDTITGGKINISTAKRIFNIVNSTNSTLNTVGAHIEVTVDYSNQEAIEFTWMDDISQGSVSTFSLPLLNSTGVKEMNAFVSGGNYAPKRTSYKVSQLQNPVNVTVNSFNPNAIDSVLTASSITMALYISNTTCDVPNPASTCLLGGSQNMGSFNPMSAIIGGGKLSFRMGVGNISVHYVNVDMMASGPPDALFDSSTTDSTSGTFASALRFGSGGPTIYDYILVSIPYTEGISSQTGLNETGAVNISIPLLYDDNWNIIWNATANGTGAGALAGNNSHYSARQSEWANLLNQSTCVTNNITSSSLINSTSPCYIDTSNNKIWVRLPHFSGTGPSVTGNVVTAVTSTTSSSSSSSSSSDGGGSGATVNSFWKNTYDYSGKDLSEQKSLTSNLATGGRVRIKFAGEIHHVGLVEVNSNSAKINVSSTPQQAILKIGENAKFDLNDDSYYDLLAFLKAINNSKAELVISSIYEKILPKDNSTNNLENKNTLNENSGNQGVKSESLYKSTWSILIIVLLLALAYFYLKHYKMKDLKNRIMISSTKSKSIKVH
ncbi:MAG: hypothetical protein Q7R87_03850 [Nanoarchaeota archaeon]|nr:hypothetical protein [Nanoarchaeota archaeon]